MLHIERRIRQRIACGLVIVALAAACSEQHPSTGAADSGTPEDDEQSGDAEVNVVVAPSGAAVEPAVTVMTSGNFRLVTSMGAASGTSSASESYELRSASTGRR